MTTTDWTHDLDRWPIPYVRVPLDLRRAGLVIVDMQRYWTDPDGPLGTVLRDKFPDVFGYFYDRLTRTTIPNLAELLHAFRGHRLPVIHITSGQTRADGRDLPPHLRRRIASDNRLLGEFNLIRVGSAWHDVVEPLRPNEDELVLNKTTRSAFHSTGMDRALRNLGLGHLVVGGIVTNGCVDLTARDAADRGYETFLVEDGCATFTGDSHMPTLQTFHRLFGTVLTAGDVMKELAHLT